jgi:hypothetical protein
MQARRLHRRRNRGRFVHIRHKKREVREILQQLV